MNTEERNWLDLIHTLPCVLIHTGECLGPVEGQHITQGGRRLGHMFCYSLCWGHHHWQSPLSTAYHRAPKQFVKKYGNQLNLLNKLRAEQGLEPITPKSKIVPRNTC